MKGKGYATGANGHHGTPLEHTGGGKISGSHDFSGQHGGAHHDIHKIVRNGNHNPHNGSGGSKTRVHPGDRRLHGGGKEGGYP